MNELLNQILDIEWEQFRTVNGEERVSCQEQKPTFLKMRTAQFKIWDDESLASYLEDLKLSEKEHRNMLREKYIRMMENSEPEKYEIFGKDLPPVSEEKKKLVADIWAIMLKQTEKMREKYPVLALGGRPLHASEEHGWSSVETYQTCELTTFSENTLRCFLKHVKDLEAQGIDIVYKIQENSVTCLGYKDMDAAEAAMAQQFMTEMGIETDPGCGCCGVD